MLPLLTTTVLLSCTDGKPSGGTALPDGDGGGDTGTPAATIDADGDGHAAAPDGGDCDDTDPSVHPDAEEQCGDGVDQDCDGLEAGCSGIIHSMEGGGVLTGGGGVYGLSRAMAPLHGWRDDPVPLIAVTAPWWEVDPYDNRGAVFVVDAADFGVAREVTDHALAAAWGEEASAVLGYSVSAADLDGDGVDDIVLGEPGTGVVTQTDLLEGGVTVIYGPLSGSDWDTVHGAVEVVGGRPFAMLGWGVGATHDLTGDGVADIAAGSPSGCWSDGYAGGVVVVDGTRLQPRSTDAGDALLAGEAACVALDGRLDIGDIDGDGIGDVVVGAALALRDEEGNAGPGRLYVFNGPVEGDALLGDGPTILHGPSDASFFGLGPSVRHDLDGDGLDDVLIGAPESDVRRREGGSAYVILGSSLPVHAAVADVATASIHGDEEGMELGVAITVAGDVDADGNRDLLVSAQATPEGDGAPGQVFLYHGPVAGTLGSEDAVLEMRGRHVGDNFGAGWIQAGGSLLGAVDLNDDGYDDWLVGADLAVEDYIGAVYSFYGGVW